MCSPCRFRWPKTTIFGKFRHFWGLMYRPPFTDEGQIWCAIADPWYTFTCKISSPSVYSCGSEKPQFFAVFWTSAFSDVANWHQSQKVEHGCTTINLPLSNGIKIVSVLQRLHGEIERTNSDVQKRDGQTKKLNVFGHPGSGWNPSPTKLGMVIEDLEHVLAPLKLLGVWCILSPLGGTEKLGETRPPELKTPITLRANRTKF